jgi:hypothetical protein
VVQTILEDNEKKRIRLRLSIMVSLSFLFGLLFLLFHTASAGERGCRPSRTSTDPPLSDSFLSVTGININKCLKRNW